MLTPYHLLGRSGLRVSRLGLGTMTFGQPDWGCDAAGAAALLDRYLEHGGNLIDTADIYAGGESERLLGRLLAERGARDRVVLATKYTLGVQPGDPNSGGNGRKAMLRAVEGSLRRLQTDYVDLFYLHAWDRMTPVEEVMRSLDDLVTAGKVRYVGLSDVPAWYASRAQVLAQWRGFEPLCALQLEYSLIERGVEYEYPDLCDEAGLSMVTWGPLASGLLSGKYADVAAAPETTELPPGRLRATSAFAPPETDKKDARTWQIVSELSSVAQEVGCTAAQLAVAWVARQRAVGSVLVGASAPDQLEATLAALEIQVPDELWARLAQVSAPPRAVPYSFLPWLQRRVNADVVARVPAGSAAPVPGTRR